MNIDEDRMTYDLMCAISEFACRPTKDMIVNDYASLIFLNQALAKLFNKYFVIDNIIKDYHRAQKMKIRDNQNTLNNYLKNFFNNRKLINDISTSYIKNFDQKQIQKYQYFKNLRHYSKQDFIDIILSYYSTFGNNIYNIVKKYFDENRIQTGFSINDLENSNDDYSGLYSFIIFLQTGYIFGELSELNTMNAGMLVHELGHAVDSETFIFPQQKNISLFDDYLSEIPSLTFEFGFYDYLEKNHIDIIGSNIMKNINYNNYYSWFKVLNYAASLKEMIVNTEGDIEIPPEEIDSINKMISGILDVTIYEDSEGNVLDQECVIRLRDSLIYALGGFFARHLSLMISDDNKEFLKILNNIITSRKEATFEELIEMTGISLEDYISGKLIYPKMDTDTLVLKNRYEKKI